MIFLVVDVAGAALTSLWHREAGPAPTTPAEVDGDGDGKAEPEAV